MCFGSKAPHWENDVTAARRPHKRRDRVETTVIRDRVTHSPPRMIRPVSPPPRPIIKPATPPPASRPLPPPAPSTSTIEFISVEEERSVKAPAPKSKKAKSRGGEDVYIERERERVRMPPPPPPQPEYETFRYVEGPTKEEERAERRRSRSITYESNPRMSGRVVERERVVIEDGGRRREYYRKP